MDEAQRIPDAVPMVRAVGIRAVTGWSLIVPVGEALSAVLTAVEEVCLVAVGHDVVRTVATLSVVAVTEVREDVALRRVAAVVRPVGQPNGVTNLMQVRCVATR